MKPRTLLAVTLALVLSPAARTLAAAGDVAAVLDTGTGIVRITGDDLANDVHVTADSPLGSTFTVTGRNGTTVNGGASAVFESVRGLVIDAGLGDDVVELASLRTAGSVVVRMGDGADVLTLSATRVLGRLLASVGPGNDAISVTGYFKRASAVRGGDGDDAITFLDAVFAHTAGRLLVDAGPGDDDLLFETSEFKSGTAVRILGRGGQDEALTNTSEFDDEVAFLMGAGDDHLVLDDTEYDKDVDLDGGRGHDDLSIRNGNSFRRIPDIGRWEE